LYLLDTNILSELRRRERADPRLLDWAHKVPTVQTFVSVISILEIEMGILQIERKDVRQAAILRPWFEEQVLAQFEGRIFPVDTAVARRCAQLHTPDRRPERDALIAATALVHGLSLVTRNVVDFKATGVKLVTP
jgi:predicted nucleic acid-binding protein